MEINYAKDISLISFMFDQMIDDVNDLIRKEKTRTTGNVVAYKHMDFIKTCENTVTCLTKIKSQLHGDNPTYNMCLGHKCIQTAYYTCEICNDKYCGTCGDHKLLVLSYGKKKVYACNNNICKKELYNYLM